MCLSHLGMSFKLILVCLEPHCCFHSFLWIAISTLLLWYWQPPKCCFSAQISDLMWGVVVQHSSEATHIMCQTCVVAVVWLETAALSTVPFGPLYQCVVCCQFHNNEETGMAVCDCESASRISTRTEFLNWCQDGINVSICLEIMLKNNDSSVQ
jgi:hypothetical protein